MTDWTRAEMDADIAGCFREYWGHRRLGALAPRTLGTGFAELGDAGEKITIPIQDQRRGASAPNPLRALDLFCGAGGASMGLHRAGFDVTGVDIRKQPRYPFRFVQADATEPPLDLCGFDFIWASPPCQRFSLATRCRPGVFENHPDLIAPIRRMLVASGAEWCIENVPLAPVRPDLVLTGDMFGLRTYRRRHFELSFFALAPNWGSPFGPESRPGTFTIAGHTGNSSLKTRKAGVNRGTKADWQGAIGIEWMSVAEMAESVPPAYSDFIGRAAKRAILDAISGDFAARTLGMAGADSGLGASGI